MIQYKTYPAQYKVDSDGKGIIEAYVSVFGNVDSYGDRVQYGAFTESIATKRPKLWYQHDSTKPIGITLETREIPAGDSSLPELLKEHGALWCKGALNLNTIDGKDVYEHIKFGSVDEYSFGYEEIDVAPNEDGTKNLNKLRFIEWSPVSLGANPLTSTASVKSVDLDGSLTTVVAQLDDCLDYIRRHADMKGKAGAAISRARRERIRSVADSAHSFYKELMALLDEVEPEAKSGASVQAQLLLLQSQFINMRFN